MNKPRLPSPSRVSPLPAVVLPQITGGTFNRVSNIMKARHETAQAALSAVR